MVVLDSVLEKVRMFAAYAHGGQRRKFTDEPFMNHPLRVMEICMQYTGERSILAASLLHDVLEDTTVSEKELKIFLVEIMDPEEAVKTLELVVDLTDVFVKEDYPKLNRRKRKAREAERLGNIHPDAQTVKYADSLDNSIDIAKNDKKFAPQFLGEVRFLLSKMNKGNRELYHRTRDKVETLWENLKKHKKIGT